MTKPKADPYGLKHRGFHAKISAKWIPVLRHFMSDFENTFSPRTHGLHIQPHPEGGVTVMATNGKMMAIVRDEAGSSTKAVRVAISKDTADACEPPRLPCLWSEGEWLPPPEVPAWMSPKWLRLMDAAVWVEPDAPDAPGLLHSEMIEEGSVYRTGQEYRILDDKPLPWMRCLPDMTAHQIEPLVISPIYLGQICLAANSAGAKSIRVKGTGIDKPVSVEFVGVPEITVVLMPILDRLDKKSES